MIPASEPGIPCPAARGEKLAERRDDPGGNR